MHHVPELIERLDPGAAEFLIREIGGNTAPPSFEAPISVGWGMDTALGVENLITGLGRNPDPEATNALAQLVADRRLAPWRRHLEHARDTQQVTRRDANYVPPTPAAIIASLRNGPPASAADLRELVLDRLERIGEELRTTNANLWRQFWTEDRQRNEPKDENACRDALLPLLRHRLSEGCDAQPEGQYAKNRRPTSGSQAASGTSPSRSRRTATPTSGARCATNCCRATRTTPPRGGLGIYLVLWFGPQQHGAGPRRPPAADRGRPPGSAPRQPDAGRASPRRCPSDGRDGATAYGGITPDVLHAK